MNILFYCNSNVCKPVAGGIVRVTGVLGEIFSGKGHKCFLAYYLDHGNARTVDTFADTVKLDKGVESGALESFIRKNSIDTIILQVPLDNSNWYILELLSVLKMKFPDLRTIHCIHQQPFAEIKGFDWHYLAFLLKWRSDKSFKEILWGITVLLFPSYAVKRTARRYQRISDGVDKVVLLSEKSIPFYRKHVHCRPGSLFGINNPVVYDADAVKDQKKEKRLLFVGRLHEPTKRLSILLNIWKKVSGQFPDWNLDIVGDGIDAGYHKHVCKRLKLTNVNFHGLQNPEEYYDRAAVILNTSPAEGFPMTLVEGMQNGLVPFSFDSYDSVTDLIDNGESGVIIKYKDIDAYSRQLCLLMGNPEKMDSMSVKAKEKVNGLNHETIYRKWEEVLCR